MDEIYIVLNLKTYPQTNDGGALGLAEMCERVNRESNVNFVVCPQTADLAFIAEKVDIPVFAQHMDNIQPGSTTGWVTPESVKSAGASGVLINHSEHRLKISDISALLERCKELALTSIVCTNDIRVSRACAVLKPDFVAVEPPELIGGNVSVTSADPEIVSDTVIAIKSLAPEVRVFTGAGVKDGEDVAKAIELGTCGVLLASGVVKAADPETTLRDLISKI